MKDSHRGAGKESVFHSGEPKPHYTPENIQSKLKFLEEGLSLSVQGKDIQSLANEALIAFAWAEHFRKGRTLKDANQDLSAMKSVMDSPAARELQENFLSIPNPRNIQMKLSNRTAAIREQMRSHIPAKLIYRPILLSIEDVGGLHIPGMSDRHFDLYGSKKRHFSLLFETIEQTKATGVDQEKRRAYLFLAVMKEIALARIQHLAGQLVSERRGSQSAKGMEKEFWKQKLIGEVRQEGLLFCNQYVQEASEELQKNLTTLWPNSPQLMAKILEIVVTVMGSDLAEEKQLASDRQEIVAALVAGNAADASRALVRAAENQPELFMSVAQDLFGAAGVKKITTVIDLERMLTQDGSNTEGKPKRGGRPGEHKTWLQKIEEEFRPKLGFLFEMRMPVPGGALQSSRRLFILEEQTRQTTEMDKESGRLHHVSVARIVPVEYALRDQTLHFVAESSLKGLTTFRDQLAAGLIIEHGKNAYPIAEIPAGRTLFQEEREERGTKAKIVEMEREEVIKRSNGHLYIRNEDPLHPTSEVKGILIHAVLSPATGNPRIAAYEFVYEKNQKRISMSKNKRGRMAVNDLTALLNSGQYTDSGDLCSTEFPYVQERSSYRFHFKVKKQIEDYLAGIEKGDS